MVRRYVTWTEERKNHLREFYNDSVKVSPAIIAYKLGIKEQAVLKKLSEWGLRKRTGNRDV